MTAEIGIMRITEQIDALDTMAINPLQYLIAPKLVAGVIGVPLLVAIFDVVGIYGGSLVGVDLLGVSEGAYWNSIESAVEWKDVYGGILKSISFGLIISWVCCYKGFYTRQSAEGLGSATTEAVVLSSVLILVVGLFLDVVLLSVVCVRRRPTDLPSRIPMIRLVGVEKKLGGQPVLQGIDLSIPVGKLTTIIGRSGEGKERAPQAHDRAHAAGSW